MGMSLQKQLRQLKRQRAVELKNAGYLFARAKRDTRKALSPDRLIRKNLGVSLGVAFVGAMLLAPGPRRARGGGGGKEKGSMLGWLLGLVERFAPQLKEYIPGLAGMMAKAQAPAEAEPQHLPPQPIEPERRRRRRGSLLSRVLAEAVGIVLARLPWREMLQRWLGGLMPRSAEAGAGEPAVAVEDAGTCRADVPLGKA